MMSPRATTPALSGWRAARRRDERRILRNATVRVLKNPVRFELLRRFQHCRRPATKQLGALAWLYGQAHPTAPAPRQGRGTRFEPGGSEGRRRQR